MLVPRKLHESCILNALMLMCRCLHFGGGLNPLPKFLMLICSFSVFNALTFIFQTAQTKMMSGFEPFSLSTFQELLIREGIVEISSPHHFLLRLFIFLRPTCHASSIIPYSNRSYVLCCNRCISSCHPIPTPVNRHTLRKIKIIRPLL